VPIVELRGKSVLLTGASTGLGPHIARRLRREGATFVLSPRNAEALRAVAGELGGALSWWPSRGPVSLNGWPPKQAP